MEKKANFAFDRMTGIRKDASFLVLTQRKTLFFPKELTNL